MYPLIGLCSATKCNCHVPLFPSVRTSLSALSSGYAALETALVDMVINPRDIPYDVLHVSSFQGSVQ